MPSALLLSEGSALLLGPDIRLLLGEGSSEEEPILFEVELHEWLKARLDIAVWAGFIPAKKSPTIGRPALVYNLISTEAEEELDGPTDIVGYTFQFDAYAVTRLEAVGLIQRLRNVLQGYIGPMGRADCLNALRGTQNHGFDILPDGSTGATQRRMVEYTIYFREVPPSP